MKSRLACVLLMLVAVCECSDQALADVMRARCLSVFGYLTEEQIENVNAITATYLRTRKDIFQLAYMLATAWVESKFVLRPEARLAPGSEQFAFQSKYWDSGYFGRGFVKIRFREVYEQFAQLVNVDIVSHPELVNDDPMVAASVLLEGMVNGHFTGAGLSDFISPRRCDFYQARRSVSGLDNAIEVASYAGKLSKMGE